jgi:hypothetical protein
MLAMARRDIHISGIKDEAKICKKALNDRAFGFDQTLFGTPGVR